MDRQIFERFVANASLDATIDLLKSENLMLVAQNRRLTDEVGEFQKRVAELSADRELLQREIDRINAKWFTAEHSTVATSVKSSVAFGKKTRRSLTSSISRLLRGLGVSWVSRMKR